MMRNVSPFYEFFEGKPVYDYVIGSSFTSFTDLFGIIRYIITNVPPILVTKKSIVVMKFFQGCHYRGALYQKTDVLTSLKHLNEKIKTGEEEPYITQRALNFLKGEIDEEMRAILTDDVDELIEMVEMDKPPEVFIGQPKLQQEAIS